MGDKLQFYEEQGVPHYWAITPEAQAIQLYELKSGRYETNPLRHPGDRLVLPFAPEITIDDISNLSRPTDRAAYRPRTP